MDFEHNYAIEFASLFSPSKLNHRLEIVPHIHFLAQINASVGLIQVDAVSSQICPDMLELCTTIVLAAFIFRPVS